MSGAQNGEVPSRSKPPVAYDRSVILIPIKHSGSVQYEYTFRDFALRSRILHSVLVRLL